MQNKRMLGSIFSAMLVGATASTFAEEAPMGHGAGMMSGMSMHHGDGGGPMKGHARPSKDDYARHKQELAPRNAAVNYIRMRQHLVLTDQQVEQLVVLRDKFIGDFSADQAKLKAAREDLTRHIYAKEMNDKVIEDTLTKIGQLEGRLWRGFIKQLKDIRGILTPEQLSQTTKEGHK